MSAKDDPVAEIQDIFLKKDEIANMMLDNVFGIVDEQISLAEEPCRPSAIALEWTILRSKLA
jgi:hypothetical protein